jgi:hypothetical protein
MSDDLGGWEFKTAGIDQTLEKMYIINEKLNSHIGDIAAAREIRDLAKDLVPVQTGHLRDSIRAWETVEGATVTAGGVSNAGSLLDGDTTPVNVDYAPYVEFGTGSAVQPLQALVKALTAHSPECPHNPICARRSIWKS